MGPPLLAETSDCCDDSRGIPGYDRHEESDRAFRRARAFADATRVDDVILCRPRRAASRTSRRSSPTSRRRRRRSRCRCDRTVRPSAFETRSQISRDSAAVSSPLIVPTFLTATNAAGARSPPNVICTPGTRQVITQRSGLPKAVAASFERSPSSAFPYAGGPADVNTWMSGIPSDRLKVRDQVIDLVRRHPGGPAVPIAATAGGVEAAGERRGAAIVHEGTAAADADQRRHLERPARPDVDGRVVREVRAGVARGAGAARRVVEQRAAALDRGGIACAARGTRGCLSIQDSSVSIWSVASTGPDMRPTNTSFIRRVMSVSSPSQWNGSEPRRAPACSDCVRRGPWQVKFQTRPSSLPSAWQDAQAR